MFSETLLFTWARFQKIIPPPSPEVCRSLARQRVCWEEVVGGPAASTRGCQDACSRPQSGLVQSETRAAPVSLAVSGAPPILAVSVCSAGRARRSPPTRAGERLCFTHLRTQHWTRTCRWNYQPTLPNQSVACFACYHRGG